MSRRDFLPVKASSAAAVIAGCGASEATHSSAVSGKTTSSASPPPAVPANLPPGTVSQSAGPLRPGLPLLTPAASQTGTLPYLVTAYPLEGSVRAGQVLEDPVLGSVQADNTYIWALGILANTSADDLRIYAARRVGPLDAGGG